MAKKAFCPVVEYRLKSALSHLEMRSDVSLLSNIFTKCKGIYTMEAYEDERMNGVSHSRQTRITLPYRILGMEGAHYGNNWK